MKHKISCTKGFTLTELLVVVLIIGILTAVALPKYKMAAMRARLTQLSVTMDAAKKGLDVYVLANNYFPAGNTYMVPGISSVEIPGKYDPESHSYRSSIGGVSAYYSRSTALPVILYRSDQVPEGYADLFHNTEIDFLKTYDEWVVGAVRGQDSESRALICQWINESGYTASHGAVDSCAAVGVPLIEWTH